MLNQIQLEKYADVIIWGLKTAKKNKLKKGDLILIQYENLATELMEIIYTKLLELEMNPVQRIILSSSLERIFYQKSNNNQLKFIIPGEEELIKNLNGRIVLRAPESLTYLTDVDYSKISQFLISRKYLRDIMNDRENEGLYSWTLCTLPTKHLAKIAGLTLKEYTNCVTKACYLEQLDPIKSWNKIYSEMNEIKKWLNQMNIKEVLVESKNIDLKITIGEKRRWVGLSGHNIPSFEIFTSPDWRGTKGKYYANQPAFHLGNYVKNITLDFQNGSVNNFEATDGYNFLKNQLKTDFGSNKIGEFSLTDKRYSNIDQFMADTLYDENYGGLYGNCHIALGSAYLETYTDDNLELNQNLKMHYGFNDSSLHWDLINTEKKIVTAILVTGEKKIIYENGIFQM